MERSLFTDNTALFRARVKAIKLRQSTAAKQRSKSPSESDSITEKTNDNVVTETPKVEEEETVLVSANFHLYTAHARQIGQHIRELADLVVERRKSYLLSTVSAYGHDELMSDADRRHFDSDTDLAMRQCSKLVRNLEFQVDNDPSLRKDDEHPHLKAVTLLLNVYLKNVCKIVSEIRALYLKKSQHLNRICRLGNLVNMYAPKIEGLRAGVEAKREELKRRQLEMERQLKQEHTHPSEPESIGPKKREDRTLEKKMEPKKRNQMPVVDVSHFDDEQNENEEPTTALNSTEQAQLTIENQQLLERLVQRNSEIEQIESQFSELQKLQQTFVEKIVEQEKDIEIIHQKTIHTLDNLDQANQFIRDAIKNSASRRVIALFLSYCSNLYVAISGLV
ncbi:hypothetical protein M3Y94_00200300 [Aphelenchoides besseyi]|nr:hypothetical protein M3Y94_00200300 [Aphelenchoides besseyi]